MASDYERTTPDFKSVEVIPLGDGYSLHLRWVSDRDWFYREVFFCDPADGKLVPVAHSAVKRSQWWAVLWAKQRKRRHQKALRLAAC